MKKKPKKKTKQIDKSKILLINLCIKRGHSKYFVVEKIGSIDIKKNIFFLNFFRFIYWTQYSPSFSVNCWKIVYKYIISIFKNYTGTAKF